jgi:hypothetical protein
MPLIFGPCKILFQRVGECFRSSQAVLSKEPTHSINSPLNLGAAPTSVCGSLQFKLTSCAANYTSEALLAVSLRQGILSSEKLQKVRLAQLQRKWGGGCLVSPDSITFTPRTGLRRRSHEEVVHQAQKTSNCFGERYPG